MPDTVARDRLSKRTQRKLVRRKNVRRIILLVALLLFLSICGTAGAVIWNVNHTLNKITELAHGGIDTPKSDVYTAFQNDNPISFVILGRDTRPETGTMNTDVMIVAVADPTTKKVTMVSIPRDTRVKIQGYRGYHKINAVYAKGEVKRRQAERNGQVPTETGETLVKKTLSGVLGIPIEHYISIDFEGFRSVIDELGGVEVDVDRKLYYNDPTDGTNIDLNPGLQVLNGDQALDYVRHREDSRGVKYYSSDFDRNRRQQEVIKVMTDKLTSLDELPKLFKLLEVAGEHLQTDLSKDQIMGLAMDLIDITPSTLVSLDNGGYWKDGYTYLDREKFLTVRTTLQREMDVRSNQISELNNSPIHASDKGTTSTNQ
ncbi:LCP family protein [Brevibacillus sp. SIMBA_040]|uniref:LCP family protein n=1 Tax=unclassified Brevibacillus TaxID=2684853 RepID=UPI00397ACD8B